MKIGNGNLKIDEIGYQTPKALMLCCLFKGLHHHAHEPETSGYRRIGMPICSTILSF
jgi:hypothetical protein